MKNKIPEVLIVILILGGGQPLFAEPKVVLGQVLIEAGEFVMGDTYCADEQGNSDWCSDEVPHKVRLKSSPNFPDWCALRQNARTRYTAVLKKGLRSFTRFRPKRL